MLKISLLFKKYELQRKITREFLGLRMRNFQGSVFIWIQTYREIFKSALVYLSKGDQINSKKGVGFFQISRKEILFFLSLGGILTIQPSFLHSPKTPFLSPSVWPRREYTWTLTWKKSLLICFESCQGVSYSLRKRRKRMMVNSTPICKG